MNRSVRPALIATAGGLLVAASLLLGRLAPQQTAPPADADQLPATPTAVAPEGDAPLAAAPLAGLPAHLADVAVDGAVNLDARGRLIVDYDLRKLLEFFLASADGDAARLPAVRASLLAYLQGQGVSAPVAEQVMAVLDRYLDYRRQAAEVALAADDLASLEAALEARYRLRRQLLGQELAEGFFAEDEAYDRYYLARRRLEQDPDLAPAQRARQLEALQQQLPPELRQAQQRATAVVRLQEEARSLRRQGADEAEIYALRAERFGPAAAERLRQLDEEEAEWARRLASYREQRDHLRRTEGLSAEDRAAAIDQLLEQSFSSHEVVRVRALERLEAQQATQTR